MSTEENLETTIHRGKCVLCSNPGTIDSYGYCEICRDTIDQESREVHSPACIDKTIRNRRK